MEKPIYEWGAITQAVEMIADRMLQSL